MDIRRIETFLMVAASGSFSTASEKLHRSHATVSAHVRELEEELGVRLLERTTRVVTITPEGSLFEKRARNAITELRTARQELDQYTRLRLGSVAIGTVPTLSSSLLPEVLVEFRGDAPDVTISLFESTAPQISQKLREGILDFAIAPMVDCTDDLEVHRICDDPFVAIYPEKGFKPREIVELQELSKENLILPPVGATSRLEIDNAFQAAGINLRPTIAFEHHHTAMRLAAVGFGVALVSSLSLSGLDQRGVRVVPISGNPIRREIAMVTLRGRTLAEPAASCARVATRILNQSRTAMSSAAINS